MHERLGHQCAIPGSIKDEQSFIMKARTHGKLTEDGLFVQRLGFYDKNHYVAPKDHFEGDNIKYNNIGDFNGDKGRPPLLGPQLLPVNLMG